MTHIVRSFEVVLNACDLTEFVFTTPIPDSFYTIGEPALVLTPDSLPKCATVSIIYSARLLDDILPSFIQINSQTCAIEIETTMEEEEEQIDGVYTIVVTASITAAEFGSNEQLTSFNFNLTVYEVATFVIPTAETNTTEPVIEPAVLSSTDTGSNSTNATQNETLVSN